MLSVGEARAVMVAAMTRLPCEEVGLADALGRTLAAPILARRDHPPYAGSAMDGYALRSQDTPGTLTVIGESAAGHGFTGLCGAGQAVRISTGAAIPDGADTIVIQEDVKCCDTALEVPATKPNRHIRARALDFAAGERLLPAGQTLDAIALALAAAAGAGPLQLVRAPRIAVLGGRELVSPGYTPGPFQIFESASYGIAGLVNGWGGKASRLESAPDAAAMALAARSGLASSDLLVVVGGASVGDHARAALLQLGLELTCHKVAVRPGKPTWFGHTRHGPVLGLPGHPASALVCAHLFLRPMIEAMLGRDSLACVRLYRARLEHDLPPNGNREQYLRARATIGSDAVFSVRALKNQDSSMLSVFERANALIRLPPHKAALGDGMVDVLLLDRPDGALGGLLGEARYHLTKPHLPRR